MRPRFSAICTPYFARCLVVGACVLAHLALVVGFPIPTPSAAISGGKPFPCQHHHCGCKSADQCWRSCCCMSMQEKLVWARENGVEPPDFVVAAVANELDEHPAHSCCDKGKHNEGGCCSARSRLATPSCCAKHASSTSKCEAPQSNSEESGFNWVLGMHAQKCRGLALIWVTTGAVTPPPPPVIFSADSNPPAWLPTEPHPLWQSLSQAPDVPPPRLV
jgi:hypothetical protein